MTPGLKKYTSTTVNKDYWIADVVKTCVARRFSEVGEFDLVFTKREAELMQTLPKELIRKIFDLKTLYPDADIISADSP